MGEESPPLKSTLSNLPTYFLSLFPIPINHHVCYLNLGSFGEVGFPMKCLDRMVWEYGNLLGRAGRISCVISDLRRDVVLGSDLGLMFGAEMLLWRRFILLFSELQCIRKPPLLIIWIP